MNDIRPAGSHRPPLVIVVAAVVVSSGRVLLTRRKQGTHLAGFWEFPGGKVEHGENPTEALNRELTEELGVSSRIGAPFAFGYHEYETLGVLLLTYEAALDGSPRAIGCSELGWFSAAQIAGLDIPPAGGPILERLLPLLGHEP